MIIVRKIVYCAQLLTDRSQSTLTRFVGACGALVLFPLGVGQPALTQAAEPTGPPLVLQWVTQYGSEHSDHGYSLAVAPDGSIYSGAGTLGSIAGPNANGFDDILLTRLNASGDIVWHRQIAANDSGPDLVWDMEALSSGGLMIAATTSRGIVHSTEHEDAYVARFNPSGTVVWQRQFGTPSNDHAFAVAVERDETVFVGGYTNGVLASPDLGDGDAYITKLDRAGNFAWIRQFGSDNNDRVMDLATDSGGNVISAGMYDEFNLPGGHFKGFVAKHNEKGVQQWLHVFTVQNVSRTFAQDVATDEFGNVYVAGEVHREDANAFVQKYSPEGALIWQTVFGTDSSDFVRRIAVDEQGGVFVAGNTRGSFTEGGIGDSGFVARIDPLGAFDWGMNFGEGETVTVEGLALDNNGFLYLSGHTLGTLGEMSFGQRDVFVAKFAIAAIPEPATAAIAVPAAICGLIGQRLRRRRPHRAQPQSVCS